MALALPRSAVGRDGPSRGLKDQGRATEGSAPPATWWQQLQTQGEQPLTQKKGVTAPEGGDSAGWGRPEHIQ